MGERVEQRHARILRILRERTSIRVTELAPQLGVSVETARRDVAALADVGRVRRVHGSVASPTTRLNARDARLTGQTPTGNDFVLGMVTPVASYFFHQIILGARAAADAAGLRLMVGVTEYQRRRDSGHIRTMIDAGADGLLLAPSWGVDGPSEADLEDLAQLHQPVVLVERPVPIGVPAAEIDRVCSDHAEGVALAVRHLVGLGHRRIGLLARATHTRPHIRRGYAAAIEALGLPDDDLSPARAKHPGDFDTFERDTTRLLDLAAANEVEAAIVHTDVDATNLLQRLAARGIEVPGDFAVISYDDELASLADLPLTAIAPAKRAIGETAVQLLIRRLTDPDAEHVHIDLIPDLNVRASCGGAPNAHHNDR